MKPLFVFCFRAERTAHGGHQPDLREAWIQHTTYCRSFYLDAAAQAVDSHCSLSVVASLFSDESPAASIKGPGLFFDRLETPCPD